MVAFRGVGRELGASATTPPQSATLSPADHRSPATGHKTFSPRPVSVCHPFTTVALLPLHHNEHALALPPACPLSCPLSLALLRITADGPGDRAGSSLSGMASEKHLYDAHEDPPIPTYEEATSSRPLSRRGPHEVSDDAERQTLLGHDLAAASSSRRRNGYYHPPSVQSARSSLDDSSGLGSPVGADDDAELRQTMEEMDILDPEAAEDGRTRRNRSRGRFSKRFYSITNSLSSFHLPRITWPSRGFAWVKSKLPTIPEEYRPGWAVIARLCGLILIISLVYMLVVSEMVPMGNGGFGAPYSPEFVRQTALQSIEARNIQDNLKYITSYDHVAGTEGSYVLGQWIESKFKDAHMDTYTHDE